MREGGDNGLGPDTHQVEIETIAIARSNGGDGLEPIAHPAESKSAESVGGYGLEPDTHCVEIGTATREVMVVTASSLSHTAC